MTNFKRVIVIAAIIGILGGGSLGLGFGLGYALGGNRTAQNYETSLETTSLVYDADEQETSFLFAEQEVELVPLDIQISDITSVVQTVSGSVVSINLEVAATDRFFRQVYSPGSGSGIIFGEDDNFVYIATNYHVVYNAIRIMISLDDEYEIEATFLGGDRDADLALISVPIEALYGKEYKIAMFGDSDAMLVGDEVVAIGNPMGHGQTATRGIISALNREITVDGRNLNVLQTDAAINPGNSGGALANIRGEVIGINTAKAISSLIEGMGYAIPSNDALVILNLILEEGTISRPHLGIEPRHIDERARDMFALPSVGVMVRSVLPGTAAYSAGLQEFDLIVRFNDITIRDIPDLAEALAQSSVGDRVVLHLYRNGIYPMDVEIVLGDANAR